MEPPSRSSPGGASPGRGGNAASPKILVSGILVPEILVPEILVPEILVVDARWRRLVPRLARLVRRAAAAGGGAGTVVLDRDLRVRRLNARHRGRNCSTNVLTFENPGGAPGAGPGAGPVAGLGGDIVLALETVRREAQAAGRLPAHHLAHLVLHGALHLRGHDHHGAGEARRMELREARLLRRLGVPNPWKPRGAVPRGGRA